MVIITGTRKPKKLDGTAEHDFLYGGYGNDWIRGGAGRDTLNGGAGKDTFEGGAGNDLLNLLDTGLNQNETILLDFNPAPNLGNDTATGFGRDDVIEVRGLMSRGIDTIQIAEVWVDKSVYTMLSFFKGGLGGLRFCSLKLDGFDSNLKAEVMQIQVKNMSDSEAKSLIATALHGYPTLAHHSG